MSNSLGYGCLGKSVGSSPSWKEWFLSGWYVGHDGRQARCWSHRGPEEPSKTVAALQVWVEARETVFTCDKPEAKAGLRVVDSWKAWERLQDVLPSRQLPQAKLESAGFGMRGKGLESSSSEDLPRL